MRKLILISIFFLANIFILTSCEDDENDFAHRVNNGTVFTDPTEDPTANATTYIGTASVPTNPFNVCTDDGAATLVLEPDDPTDENGNFNFFLTGPDELATILERAETENIAYGATNATSFDGVRVVNDIAGDFSAVATGCDSQGGYSNVVEITINGETTNGNMNVNAASFAIRARCNDTDSFADICIGIFSGSEN